MSKQLIKV